MLFRSIIRYRSSYYKVLIIELKRGGFEIKRNERNQAQNYIEDLMALGIKAPSFNAFVVGASISDNLLRSPNILLSAVSTNWLKVVTYIHPSLLSPT